MRAHLLKKWGFDQGDSEVFTCLNVGAKSIKTEYDKLLKAAK
jgi:hypothetical protein